MIHHINCGNWPSLTQPTSREALIDEVLLADLFSSMESEQIQMASQASPQL